MSIIKETFIEKFRPKTFDKMILFPRLMGYTNNTLNQNLFLYGPSGTGKTTFAKIISANHDTYYVDGSLSSKVEILREDITNFCQNQSLLTSDSNLPKVVIFDEIEGVSDQFFKALRGFIENFSNVRFIAITNFINEVPPQVLSRFQEVPFYPIDSEEELFLLKEQKKKIYLILKACKIDIDPEALHEFTKSNFPDLRKSYNKIQDWKLLNINNITLNDLKKINFSFSDLFELIATTKITSDNYKIIVNNYGNKNLEVFQSLSSEFLDYLKINYSEKLKFIADITIIITKYQALRTQVINQDINLLACIFELQKILV